LYITVAKFFSSLPALIDYHKVNPLTVYFKNIGTALMKPAGDQSLPMWLLSFPQSVQCSLLLVHVAKWPLILGTRVNSS
jgi:hypothetical protein